ncbi:MAG: Ig-like domain-containing protein [Clostridia bacterium]|nr:Ig-like domain-containing protein [Clostridia bacterium]
MKKSFESALCTILSIIMLCTVILPTVNALYDDPMSGRFENGGTASKNSTQEEIVYVHDPKFSTGYTRAEVVDVSSHNGDINWSSVAASGIKYAMVRAGYRGYGSDGALNTDSKFRANVSGAIAAGLDVGVYFYTQATSNAEAVAEADYVIGLISGFDLRLPVAYDCEFAESGGNYTGRFYNARLTSYQITSMCNAFCDRVVSAGYSGMVYANPYMFANKINAASLQYPVWLASFSDSAKYDGDYTMWQYSSKETVPGIDGNVDKSFYYIKDGTAPERFRVHTSKLNVYLGETAQMSAFFDSAEFLNAGCRVGGVTWASSNEEVLKVDSYGNVTTVALGQASVTATLTVSVPDSRASGGYTDYIQQKTIPITVSEKPPEPDPISSLLPSGGGGDYITMIMNLLSMFIKFIARIIPMLTGGLAQ